MDTRRLLKIHIIFCPLRGAKKGISLWTSLVLKDTDISNNFATDILMADKLVEHAQDVQKTLLAVMRNKLF